MIRGVCCVMSNFVHQSFSYSLFHIKGTWSVHSFNGDYLSIPEDTGSCGYLFHEIPGMYIVLYKLVCTHMYYDGITLKINLYN